MNELKPSEYVERLYQNIKMNWNQGAAAERERIIKLPEQKVCADSFCAHDLCVHTLQLIELIKGEQK